MPSRVWSYICKEIGRAKDGQWLPIDQVSSWSVERLPVEIRGLHVISNWSGAENEHFTVQTILKSPSGAVIGESPANDCVIKRNSHGILSQRRLDALFLVIPIRELGEYRFEFLVDGVPVHVMPLEITLKS